MAAADAALGRLAETLGTDRREAARGIMRIANNNMVNAIKLISVNRGLDPRDFTLIAFGGGGGLHACALAADLGIRKVVIPSLSGVFSAWGMLLSDLRRDYLLTRIVDLSNGQAAAEMDEAFAGLEAECLRQFEAESISASRVRFLRYGRCRYQNQEHSVEIDLPHGGFAAGGTEAVREHFHASYEREYTYRLAAPVELVCFHLVAIAEVDKLTPRRRTASGRALKEAAKGGREVDYAEAGVHTAAIYDGDLLEPGMAFAGPAVIEEAGTTVVVPPGERCRVDEFGNYLLGGAS
jgi:N-methylhydantoinase A